MSHTKTLTEGSQEFPSTLSAYTGLGWRHPHYRQVLEEKPQIPWLEVHSENFMMDGGPAISMLSKAREMYPISLHGVCLSLGSANGIADDHLAKLKRLIGRIDPCLVSEHISWGQIAGQYMCDLLPVPYTDEALIILADNIDKMQTYLGRQILVENPSTYLEFSHSELTEPQFITELLDRTGAGLLLDINNIYVSCENHNWDAIAYLKEVPAQKVGEVHLAGHAVVERDGHEIRIDDHSSKVCDGVWNLYRGFVKRAGPKPTLIEWDGDIPELDVLLCEAEKSESIIREEHRINAA